MKQSLAVRKAKQGKEIVDPEKLLYVVPKKAQQISDWRQILIATMKNVFSN